MAQPTVVVDIALLGKMAGYIEMLVKDPYSTVFASLSDIYRTFSLYDEAVDVARKGTEMVPTYAPGFVALGRALAEKGNPAAASGAYRQALSLDPVNIAALTGLASSSLGCGQNDEAMALLMRAQSVDPDDEVVKQLFPVVQKLISIPVVSSEVVQSVVAPPAEVTKFIEEEQSEPVANASSLPPIATATLAEIYIKQGFYERALKVFADLLADDPANTEIQRRYDELSQQINSVVVSKIPEVVMRSSIDVEPDRISSVLPTGSGKDALMAIYDRWLDAISRRKADVH